MDLGLFTRTIDNRFIFSLFEFLLSGVTALIVLKAWRGRSANTLFAHQWCLLPATVLLSFSLGYSTFWTGARFFFRTSFLESPVVLASHICLAGTWIIVGLQFLAGEKASLRRCWGVAVGVAGLSVSSIVAFSQVSAPSALFEGLAGILDWVTLLFLSAAIYRLSRMPAPALRVLTASLCLFWLAAISHLGSSDCVSFPLTSAELLFWNLEQLAFSSALFVLALAIGEMSTNLFDIVFIRVHVAFILVASLIILVVTRTEQSEYLSELRGRSQSLAAFAVTSLESSFSRGQSLRSAFNRPDLLTRVATDFGNLPELAAVEIRTGNEMCTLEIGAKGEIQKKFFSSVESIGSRFEDQDRYFLIGTHPLNGRNGTPGLVQLYGLKDYIDRYARRRTAWIFALFTAGVALATVMIGLVTQHAERTLQRQKEELRAQQEELAMASKLALLGEMAGSVAHEINTPVTTILSRASFLLKRSKNARPLPDAQEDLAAIVEQAQRIGQITSSLLGFSRKHVFEISSVSICEVIEKSLSLVRGDLCARSIEVTIRGCPCPEQVAGDRNALVQVFVNLFRNAFDAMPEGGEISIDVSFSHETKPSLHVLFSDTGAGIAKEHLGRIFLPFFTTKETGKGTGLGLSVVHGIISEHKGSIRVESRRGSGTSFYIQLPAKERNVKQNPRR